jgi:hypothetical protein
MIAPFTERSEVAALQEHGNCRAPSCFLRFLAFCFWLFQGFKGLGGRAFKGGLMSKTSGSLRAREREQAVGSLHGCTGCTRERSDLGPLSNSPGAKERGERSDPNAILRRDGEQGLGCYAAPVGLLHGWGGCLFLGANQRGAERGL